MLAFQGFRVVSFSRAYFDLYWETVPSNDDPQDWQFFVERSEAEASGYAVLAGPLIDQYFLRDDSVHTRNEYRPWFYRIRAFNPRTGAEVYSDVADSVGPADLLGEEVTRVETIVWKEYAGIALWVFPRRTFGQFCPSCYDARLGKSTEANCEVCWGTRFSGGYHRPVKTFGQISQPTVENVITVSDHIQPFSSQLTCPPSPTIRPGDLVIDARNWRWSVLKQDASTRLGVDVRQIVTLFKVEPGDIKDRIPLRIDTAVEELRGPRNFNNPQDIEAAHEVDMSSFDEIFGFR